MVNTNQADAHGAPLRPAVERRLPAAEGRSSCEGKSAVEEIGDRPQGHAQLLRRGRHDRRRQGPRPTSRRSSSRPSRGSLNVAVEPSQTTLQAGPEGRGEGQAHRPGRQAVRRLDRAGRLRQGRRIHLGRLERRRRSRPSSGSGGGRTTRRPSRASTAARPTSRSRARSAWTTWARSATCSPERRSRLQRDGQRMEAAARMGGRCARRRLDGDGQRRRHGHGRSAAAADGRAGGRGRADGGTGRRPMRCQRTMPSRTGRRRRRSSSRRSAPTSPTPPSGPPSLTTGADGTAEVDFDLPESLTTWKVKTWAMGHGHEGRPGRGRGRHHQGPARAVPGPAVLRPEGRGRALGQRPQQAQDEEVGPGRPGARRQRACSRWATPSRTVEIDARGGAPGRLAGEGRPRGRGRRPDEGPHRRGIRRDGDDVPGLCPRDAQDRVLRRRDPARRRSRPRSPSASPPSAGPSRSRLEVRYSPTLAGAMVDALPYLVDYPYGCTEQTLNRFLPTVITQKVLIDLGLDLKAIRDKRTNLNAQEIGDARERAKSWKRFPSATRSSTRPRSATMVKAGPPAPGRHAAHRRRLGLVLRLRRALLRPTPRPWSSTASVARRNDLALSRASSSGASPGSRPTRPSRSASSRTPRAKTSPYKEKADNLDAFVDMVLADGGVKNDARCSTSSYRDRTELSVYAKAMFGLALRARAARRTSWRWSCENIGQFVVRDDENQTAYLKLPDDELLVVLVRQRDRDPRLSTSSSWPGPTRRARPAPRLVKYLLNNRKHATYWDSTRDTAVCIEALADYLKASGEDRPDMTVEIARRRPGRARRSRSPPADLFTFDNALRPRGRRRSTAASTRSSSARRAGARSTSTPT